MKRSIALAVAALLLSSCTEASTADEPRTLGVLRPVPDIGSGFLEQVRSAGWTPERNLVVLGADAREVHTDPADIAETLERWRDQGLDVLIAYSTAGAATARDVLADIPIVFVSNDPIATGLVENERSPEGQLTGVTYRVATDRTLHLARRAIPDLDRVGLVSPEGDPAAAPHRASVEEAAAELGIELTVHPFTDAATASDGVSDAVAAGADAVLLSNAPSAIRAAASVSNAARRAQVPLVANTTHVPGALIVLEPDTEVIDRQLARQVVRLLDGAAVETIPVEDPRRFRFVLDAKVAARLGLELPNSLIREADEVVT